MDDLEKVLKGFFKFKSWSSYETQPRDFENKLEPFGWFSVYKNFKDFLENNKWNLEDFDGNRLDMDAILSTKEKFAEYMDVYFNLSGVNQLTFEQLDEPLLYAEAKDTTEPYNHFISLSDLKTEDDLFCFINEVLRDLGEVTHSTGIKNECTVVAISP